MRFQPELSTYSHDPQRKKKEQKERNDYYESFILLNPEGTIQKLLTGDILTSYEHRNIAVTISEKSGKLSALRRRLDRKIGRQ